MKTGDCELDRQHEGAPINMVCQDKWQKRHVSCCWGSERCYWSKRRKLKAIPPVWGSFNRYIVKQTVDYEIS
jgi:hypothetical protein